MYKILIVDDDEFFRYEFRRAIEWEKYDFTIVDEAENGHDALVKLNEHKDIDLLITDIKMPKVDGIELLKEAKARNLCKCAIFFSVHDDFDLVKQGFINGAFDYILKPPEPDNIIDVLKRCAEFLKKSYEHKYRCEELINKLRDNFEIFYPVEREKKLIKQIIFNSEDVHENVDAILSELDIVLNGNVYKIGLMLNLITMNITDKLTDSYPSVINILDVDKIKTISFEKLESFEQQKDFFKSVISEMLYAFSYYKLDLNDETVKKICKFIVEKIDTKINLKTVSDMLFMSRNYLCYLFKKKTGENLIDFVTKAKMERAKLLMKNNRLKTYEVSSLLGFSEANYFSRLFKKHTGFSPSEYKKHLARLRNSEIDETNFDDSEDI